MATNAKIKVNMNIFDKKNLVLLKEFIKTDFKLRYQESVIGYLWSVLRPLMLFAVMYMVFVRFLRFGQGVPHWAVAMLLGTVIWTFFNEATNRSLFSIVARGGLLRKINFPKVLVVFSEVAGALINFGINLVVVVIFMFANGVRLRLSIITIIPLSIELLLITTGISLILATIYVSFRDMSQIWEVLLQIGFYATPIIYPLSQLQSVSPKIAKLAMMNPVAQVIQDFRTAIIGGGGEYIQIFQLIHNPIVALVPYLLSVVIFILGYWIFTSKADKFAEII